MTAFLIWLSALYVLYYCVLAAKGGSGERSLTKTTPRATLIFNEQCAPADAEARMAECRADEGPGATAASGRALRVENISPGKTMKQYQLEAHEEASEFTKKISF